MDELLRGGGELKKKPVPTVLCLLLVSLKAYFNLNRRNRHNLSPPIATYTQSNRSKYKLSYLERAADRLRTDFREANVVELSFLHHFIENLCIVFDLVVRVASRRLE